MTLAVSLVPGMMLLLLNHIKDRMKTPEKCIPESFEVHEKGMGVSSDLWKPADQRQRAM